MGSCGDTRVYLNDWPVGPGKLPDAIRHRTGDTGYAGFVCSTKIRPNQR